MEQPRDRVLLHSISVLKIQSTSDSKWSSLQGSMKNNKANTKVNGKNVMANLLD